MEFPIRFTTMAPKESNMKNFGDGPLAPFPGPLGPGTDKGAEDGRFLVGAPFKALLVTSPVPGVVEVQFNNPETKNAMGMDFVRELHAVLDALNYDHTRRVLILRGVDGNGGFCSGFNMRDKQIAEYVDQHGPANQRAFSGLIKKLRELPQPVICGVHGSAAGGGFGLALAGDVRLAGKSASFIPSFVRMGLGGAEMGTSFLLPRMIGRTAAAEVLLTGRAINAERAERLGLVTEVVEDAELGPKCLAMAEEMLGVSPKGLRLTKWALENNDSSTLLAALEREDLAQVYTSRDKESMSVGRAHMARIASGGAKKAKL